jgi:hypothetical protein
MTQKAKPISCPKCSLPRRFRPALAPDAAAGANAPDRPAAGRHTQAEDRKAK